MNIILTSSLGGSFKVDGKRIPSTLLTNNGLLDKLKELWVEDSKVMIICASPNDYEKNRVERAVNRFSWTADCMECRIDELCVQCVCCS